MKYYIYKICCDDVKDFVYVGSTQNIRCRKNHHKSICNNENDKKYNRKIYQTIRANGGWEKWRMVCIHEQECETKTQAVIIEERYRQELNANMNSQRCYRTEEQNKEYMKEYNKERKEETKEYNKEYYENNKEEIKEKTSKKYTCACGSELRWDYKAKHEKTKKHKEFLHSVQG